jgi:hypothetical protein
MEDKKYIITETQLKSIIKTVINEQGLYGDASDVVDYDLPEYLSDVIILSDLESFNDVEKSVKELHKRLIRLEKGLTSGGSHNKAYSTTTDYSLPNKKSRGLETKGDSEERDEELRREIEILQQMIKDNE